MTDEKNVREDRLNKLTTPTPKDVEKAKTVMQSIRRTLLRQPGVTALDVGYRVEGSDFANEVAIRVHVERKLHQRVLAQRGENDLSVVDDLVQAGIPRTAIEREQRNGKSTITINGVLLDIIEARYFPTQAVQVRRPVPNDKDLADREKLGRTHVNPLVGGLSVGSTQGPAGTLGAIVWDKTDGSACLLSNWHVLAGSLSAAPGQDCYQPALFDGGGSQDRVATLKRWYFGRKGDGALAEILPVRYYCPGEILGLYYPVTGMVEPQLGMKVYKWGRTTCYTKGFIDGIAMSITLDYGNDVVQSFEDQVHIAPRFSGDEVSAKGDSGAIWVTRAHPFRGANFARILKQKEKTAAAWLRKLRDQTGKKSLLEEPVYYAVALNFAGDVPESQFGEYAVASSITNLAGELEFSLRPLFVERQGLVQQQRNPLSQAGSAGLASPEQMAQQFESGARVGASGERSGGGQTIPEKIKGGG